MFGEILHLVVIPIAAIVFMWRVGLLCKLLPQTLVQKIRAELSSLKVSAPNLKSTTDSSNSASP